MRTTDLLSERQSRLLKSVAAIMIAPCALERLPGADDATVFADILATAKRHSHEVVAALDKLSEYTQSTFSSDFEHLSDLKKVEILNQLRADNPDVLTPLVAVVTQCYYRDARVMLSLDMPVRAPFPEGYEVEQGDWSLLDVVKQRATKIYRDA